MAGTRELMVECESCGAEIPAHEAQLVEDHGYTGTVCGECARDFNTEADQEISGWNAVKNLDPNDMIVDL